MRQTREHLKRLAQENPILFLTLGNEILSVPKAPAIIAFCDPLFLQNYLLHIDRFHNQVHKSS